MIQVSVRNNAGATRVIVDENTTVRTVLEQNDIDYSRGITSLDGTPLQPGDMDKTFADFGIKEKCFLANVIKANNA